MVGQAWLYIWVIEKQGSPFPTLTRWSAISKHFLCFQILSICFIVELMGRHLLYCGTDLGEACLELFLFHILPPCSVCASTCFSVEQHLARGTKFDHCTAWEGFPGTLSHRFAHTIGMQSCARTCTVKVLFIWHRLVLFQKGHFPLYILYKICSMKELQLW